jgi:hypothetical protein
MKRKDWRVKGKATVGSEIFGVRAGQVLICDGSTQFILSRAEGLATGFRFGLMEPNT